jgi:hypothetical protein
MDGFINIRAAVSPESFSINFELMSRVSFALTVQKCSAMDATTAFVGDFSQLVIDVGTAEKRFEKLALTFTVCMLADTFQMLRCFFVHIAGILRIC